MGLHESTVDLLARTVVLLEGHPAAQQVQTLAIRMAEPLRVAIAGRVKAGKSTLLNALLRERLAPTDVRECTQVITWYCDGPGYALQLEDAQGVVLLPFTRDDGELFTDLAGRAPADVRRLLVTLPAKSLRTMTLIDSPGIDALDSAAELATRRFLTPEDDRDRQADAVLYLMNHVHREDLAFLDSFHDDGTASASPLNAIGVLSRSDEIGAGRLDALGSAQRIASRLQNDATIRRLCQTVVPVVGLLAQGADGLTEPDAQALRVLASGADVDALMRSVDAFREAAVGVSLASDERDVLLRRFGLYGVRVAVDQLRRNPGCSTIELVRALRAASGVDELVVTIEREFGARAAVLRARSVLLSLETIADEVGGDAGQQLHRDLEQRWASEHDLAELRLLIALRSGHLDLSDEQRAEAERVVGGGTAAQRVGLAEGGTSADLLQAVMEAHDRWQRRAEHPRTAPSSAAAMRVLVRTLEGALAELSSVEGYTHPAG